ncbi:MAG TPA: hypothetical protein VFS60_20050, partial [Thermoanaerobaculia bacterium]|nr:hypothetical protein [Thermoanaerobaculia bacterium]
SEVFVGSTMTLAAICGFFSGYLPTRLFLWLALTESDLEGSNLPRLYQERKAQTVKDVEAVQAAAALPAAAVGEGSSAERGDVITTRQEIQELAARYESLRATLPPGRKRTAKMEEVLHQMRQLAPRLDPDLLTRLEQSNAPGEKLAFIAWLQVFPRAEKLRWLADCLGSEKPFVGYHAAVALHTAAVSRSIDPQSVLEAIRRAQSLLEPPEAGTDRARMLRDAEREAKARL